MRHLKNALTFMVILSFVFTSCKKTADVPGADEVSPETITKISNLGFNTSNVQATEGGYLVEGDIFLSNESLNERPTSPTLRIAVEEQYRTFNLVKGSRAITISVSGSINAGFSTAIDNAIARYNAQGLTLTFQRVASGGNINVRIVNTGQYIASAGFPTSSGDPYSEIKYANRYTTYSDGFMTTVLTHEIGHCIGFRHTDYMNRSYSCGSGGNEGQETTGVGAVYIPGTASGPDAKSWMLACLSSTTNRPFNSNDVTALKYLY